MKQGGIGGQAKTLRGRALNATLRSSLTEPAHGETLQAGLQYGFVTM